MPLPWSRPWSVHVPNEVLGDPKKSLQQAPEKPKRSQLSPTPPHRPPESFTNPPPSTHPETEASDGMACRGTCNLLESVSPEHGISFTKTLDELLQREAIRKHLLVLDGALDRCTAEDLYKARESGSFAGVAGD